MNKGILGTPGYIEGLADAIITFASAGDFSEVKKLAEECIILDSANGFALLGLALSKTDGENWSDESVFVLGKYVSETYAGVMKGADRRTKSKLARFMDDMLSDSVLNHIQDCQYRYENGLSEQQKKAANSRFCLHAAALIDLLFAAARVTLVNASDEGAVKSGLGMLEACLAATEEVGPYLDAFVCSKTPYTETRCADIKSLVRACGLQQTVKSAGDMYFNLYYLFDK